MRMDNPLTLSCEFYYKNKQTIEDSGWGVGCQCQHPNLSSTQLAQCRHFHPLKMLSAPSPFCTAQGPCYHCQLFTFMFPAHQRLTGEDKRGREGGMEAKYPSKATSVNRCHIHFRRRGRPDDKDCKSSLSSFHSPLTDCHKRLPATTWWPLTTTIDHPDHQPAEDRWFKA